MQPVATKRKVIHIHGTRVLKWAPAQKSIEVVAINVNNDLIKIIERITRLTPEKMTLTYLTSKLSFFPICSLRFRLPI
jgi:hypothetical protein